MNIDSIQNGIVLDHITAGKALQIYNDLHLDKLDCSVAIIKNVKSEVITTLARPTFTGFKLNFLFIK